MRMSCSWGGMRYSAPFSVTTAISSTDTVLVSPASPSFQQKKPSKANTWPGRMGLRAAPWGGLARLRAGEGRAHVVRPEAHGVAGAPGHGQRAGLLHPVALGLVHVVAPLARHEGRERDAAALLALLPILQRLLRRLRLARREHVGEALDVRHPHALHADAEVRLDEVAGLNHAVRGVRVAPVRAGVDVGVLVRRPAVPTPSSAMRFLRKRATSESRVLPGTTVR